MSQVVDETADFSGADLKRVVEDAKTLYAYDRATGQPERGITDYFLLAVNDVRTNKQRYEEAQAQANRPIARSARPGFRRTLAVDGADEAVERNQLAAPEIARADAMLGIEEFAEVA